MKNNFTLIELIVVIAIIAVLAAIIALHAFQAIEKSKISKVISDMRAIKTAALAYYADMGKVPCNKVGGMCKDPGFVSPITAANCWPDQLIAGESCTAGSCLDGSAWDGSYLERWPEQNPWNLLVGCPGRFNWNHWPTYGPGGMASCSFVGMLTFETHHDGPPLSVLLKIDKILDDGNLTTGKVFGVNGTTGVVDGVNPDFINYIIVCN
jgi:general secretion pathway protein G